METSSTPDQESETPVYDVATYSRVFDDLFHGLDRKTYPTREAIASLVKCLEHFENEDDLLVDCCRRLADLYISSPSFVKAFIIRELVCLGNFIISCIFASNFTSNVSKPSFPRHLTFLFGLTHPETVIEEFTPYLKGFGRNSSYNLGFSSNETVDTPKFINIDNKIVVKISMSNKHTLFQTIDGDVYGCGNTSKGQLGFTSSSLVVTPIKLKFPQTCVINDMVACEDYSIFVSDDKVFLCGFVPFMNDGKAFNGMRFDKFDSLLESRREERLINIVASPKNALVFTEKKAFICGSLTKKTYNKWTELSEFSGRLTETYEPARTFVHEEKVCYKHTRAPVICSQFLSWLWFDPSHNHSKNILSDMIRDCGNTTSTIHVDGTPREIITSTPKASHFEPVPRGNVSIVAYSEYFCRKCMVLVSGVGVNLDISNLEVCDGNKVFFIGAPTVIDGNFPPVHSGMMPCLYKGVIRVSQQDRPLPDIRDYDDDEEVVPDATDTYIFDVEEVPGTHGISVFAVSPDGQNCIYKIESNNNCMQQRTSTSGWKTHNVQHLNQQKHAMALEPTTTGVEIKFQELSYLSSREILQTRAPKLMGFVDNNVLDVEKVSNRMEIDEQQKHHLKKLFKYLCGRDCFVRKKSRAAMIPTYKSAFWAEFRGLFESVGVDVIIENSFARLVPSILSEDKPAEDCMLITDSGVEIPVNYALLSLNSAYFEVFMGYKQDQNPVFKVDAPEHVVRDVVRLLYYPHKLLDMRLDNLCELLVFCDQYGLEALIDDVFDAIFKKATDDTIPMILQLYDMIPPHLKDEIVEHFSSRINLVLFSCHLHLFPLTLLRLVSERIGQSHVEDQEDVKPVGISFSDFQEEEGTDEVDAEKDPMDCILFTGRLQRISTYANAWKEVEIVQKYRRYFRQRAPYQLKHCVSNLLPKLLTKHSKQKRDRMKSIRTSTAEQITSPRLSESMASPEKEIVDIVEKIGEQMNIAQLVEEQPEEPPTNNTAIPEASISETSKEAPEKVEEPCASAWNVDQHVDVAPIDTTRVVKHKTPKKKFAEKGERFRRTPEVFEDNVTTHMAPWASGSPSTSSGMSLQDIQREEQLQSSPVSIPTPRRSRPSMSTSPTCWNAQKHQSSPAGSSLNAIMEEQKQRERQSKEHTSKPLAFVEMEERAIEELQQLYFENAGDEVTVKVERVGQENVDPVWGSFETRRF